MYDSTPERKKKKKSSSSSFAKLKSKLFGYKVKNKTHLFLNARCLWECANLYALAKRCFIVCLFMSWGIDYN